MSIEKQDSSGLIRFLIFQHMEDSLRTQALNELA